MRLYLDDDTAAPLLARCLRQAGHDVQLPNEVGMAGRRDAVHLTYAVQAQRVLLTKNYSDFEDLHLLSQSLGGKHPGILVIREDNNKQRDLRPGHIVRAIQNLLASGMAIENGYFILNHWR